MDIMGLTSYFVIGFEVSLQKGTHAWYWMLDQKP